ncbi:hypothetical protein B5M42_011615 [Paenibacillus athensensis]|uniref:Uncharacterized protein n=1 Tax=Paenibacillus athensensis TaxID=1967502 RepID=A0A4Y8Q5I3_9BACL|nr:hypothetical protein [Paenibacillus athensensis]MCD1259482.1 hypothetical protein [Paenibacillus athensensis]
MERQWQIEKILWSIALPGFGQILNKKYVKGLLFIGLEFVVNMNAHLNDLIIFSFQGDTRQAIQATNYQWLMFYPCLYMFAIYDAYRDAAAVNKPYVYLPYIAAAYFATLGVVYSAKWKLFGVTLGPVWLPIGFCLVGIGIGHLLRMIILHMGRAAK